MYCDQYNYCNFFNRKTIDDEFYFLVLFVFFRYILSETQIVFHIIFRKIRL